MGPDRLAACGRKRLLFVGDSTMQELMWELIFLTSCGVKNESVHGSACTPISRKNLPVHHCANRRCMALGQQWANESGVNSSVYPTFNKLHYRCFAMSACTRAGLAIFDAAHLPFEADFLWSGNAGIVQNGGGLLSILQSSAWRDYYYDMARAAPYDAVVFTAGLHDVYYNPGLASEDMRVRSNATQAYADGLARMLALLAKLAPSRRFFLSMAHRRGFWAKPPYKPAFKGLDIIARVNPAMVRQSNMWTTLIDASPMEFAQRAHCAQFSYNSTHVGFISTTNCTVFAMCIGRLACAHIPHTHGSADVIECTWWPLNDAA